MTLRAELSLGRDYASGFGGTANLAVLGGNLPPSRAHKIVQVFVSALCVRLSGW
jgi:hypothetical protein